MRLQDIQEVDSLLDEITDESELAAWQLDVMQKFY